LYGLKQALRVWYKVVDKFFINQGLRRSEVNPAVYIKKELSRGQLPLIVAIYVDNLIITGSNIGRINVLKRALERTFNITDLREVKNLLGIEIQRLEDGSIFLYQTRYIKDTLRQFHMENSTLINTLIALKVVASEELFS
jgi:hypothetical protein